MIAKLWADSIINNKKTFSQVPSKLRDKVKALLVEAGREDLVTE